MAKEILIADSDVADQEEFKRIFDTAGYHLIFSETGEDAIFRVRLFKPDLIIAAMALSKKNGLELCQAIKANPEYKNIPFVLLTEIFEDISEEDRKRASVDGILSKPFERREVLDLTDQLIIKEGAEVMEGIRAEEEEEIIELLDVVEEPEPRMSIEDLIAADREISSLEPPEKLPEEKPGEDEKLKEESLFPPEETEIKREGLEPPPKKEVSPEDQLLEEIELGEILEEVEQPEPTAKEQEPAAKKKVHQELEQPGVIEKSPEDLFTLEEFETDLKAQVTSEAQATSKPPLTSDAQEADLKEFLLEEPKGEGPAEISPKKMTLEEELSLFEESFEEPKEQPKIEPAPIENAMETEVEEEELTLFEEPFEEPKEQPEMEPPPPEKAVVTEVEEEELSELSEEEFPEALLEEVLKEEEIGIIGTRKERRVEEVGEAEAPMVSKGVISPMAGGGVDRRIEEVITKGLQNMMEDFITKVVPEMAQNVIVLAVDRIEKMVKEIVPELAEKAIQEEIKRLQKGEKD